MLGDRERDRDRDRDLSSSSAVSNNPNKPRWGYSYNATPKRSNNPNNPNNPITRSSRKRTPRNHPQSVPSSPPKYQDHEDLKKPGNQNFKNFKNSSFTSSKISSAVVKVRKYALSKDNTKASNPAVVNPDSPDSPADSVGEVLVVSEAHPCKNCGATSVSAVREYHPEGYLKDPFHEWTGDTRLR